MLWTAELVQGVLETAELSPETAFGGSVLGGICTRGMPRGASVGSGKLSPWVHRYVRIQPLLSHGAFQHLPLWSRLMLRSCLQLSRQDLAPLLHHVVQGPLQ